jgi:antitoxin CcdA
MCHTGMANRLKSGKRTIKVAFDAAVLSRAKSLGLDVSAVLEDSLLQIVRTEEGRRWQEENKAAIEALNRQTRKHGLWSSRLRQF